jgi:hypothetical protein
MLLNGIIMKRILIFTFAIFLVKLSYSQSVEADSLSKAKISELEFMAGKWKGSGWMMGRDGQKSEFEQSEDIQFKLDSTMLLIEGLGTSQGKVVHNALALITYDKSEDKLVFRSYLQNGQNGEFAAELTDGKLFWYPNPNVRYIVGLNESGQWYETGEFKRGENWTRFFEMTLDRE